MIRLLHIFKLVRSAAFSSSCHINQFVDDFSNKIKLNSDGQCSIRSELSLAFDGFFTASLHHPSPLVLLSDKIADTYRPLNSNQKITFFKILADTLPPTKDKDFPDTFSSTQLLSHIPTPVSISLCSSLLYSIAMCREGLEFVLQIKTDLKSILSTRKAECAGLTELQHALHQVAGFWSREKFLNFQQITTASSDELTKNLITAEAVHPISTREEFDRRVRSGRCFTVTHTQLSPDIPLSLIYCAPINYFPTHIQPLLNGAGFKNISSPHSPDTACFYSVSNAHPGFGGTEIAHQLIKYAVKSLRHEFPSLNNFLTISPIPQFRLWFTDNNILTSGDTLECFSSKERRKLLEVCANYLVNVKKGKHVMDPVANFHLKNGAILWKINWLANPSERGISQSFGIMANYLYDLNNLDLNRSRYLNDGVVNTSPTMQRLLGINLTNHSRF